MQKTLRSLTNIMILLQFVPLIASAALHESLQERRAAAKQEVEQKRQDFKTEVQKRKDDVRQGIQQTKQGLQERKEAVKTEVKTKREELKAEGMKVGEEVKKEFQTKRMDLRAEVEQRKEEFKKNREAVREEVHARRKEFVDEAKARKEELKKKLGEERAKKIEEYFMRMSEKFHAAFGRLKQFADRIELRLNRAESNGKDVTELSAKLVTAREKIAEAERALEDAKARYTDATKEVNFKTGFEKVRQLVHGVSQKVKEAHQALVAVVSGLKGIGNGEETVAPPAPANQ